MKNDKKSSMIEVTKKMFEIIKNDYSIFLSNEKIEMIDNLDYNNFLIYTDNLNIPFIYKYIDKYYINNPNLDYSKLIILICFCHLCGEITPLKLLLILIECKNLLSKYQIQFININPNELEIGNIIKEKILVDIPYNIIFLDSDIEIFNYLAEEIGIKGAKTYALISKLMNNKYEKLPSNFTYEQYLNYQKNINYDDVYDVLYNYVNENIKMTSFVN